jgi:hypothetical protein
MEEKPVLVKKIDDNKKKFNFKPLLAILITIILGGATGYFLSTKKSVSGGPAVTADSQTAEVKKGVVVGITDEETFKDSAEGELKKGGLNGEGSHHLERPGGESQNVYLTSSIVDLDKFAGRKVKVWGETFSAQKAGWLMDVGKLQVLN